ncbi:MAG: thioredoxin family protein [Acidobacteriota bacterium]|jgi:peroxiredoxin|nr:thioredoxin family protein [Acidobacteriota bacterium]
MARTPSTMMLPLGAKAPDFSLPDPFRRVWTLADFEDAPALLVAFICNHCPFVKHVRAGFAQLAREYQERGVAVVGVSSNDFEAYPDDSPEAMAEEIRTAGYTFPYLVDESQQVARDYRAACTPDFFVFDRAQQLVYRGQMDGSRPGNEVPVTGEDLRRALDAVLEGRPVADEQRPSLGCNIKWKPGREPEYFKG